MIRRIGGAEAAGFPGHKSRDQEGRKPPEKTAATPVTSEQKKTRPDAGPDCGKNLDIYS